MALNIFAAGFHTISVAFSGVVFELAWAPSLQERLHQELVGQLDKLDPSTEEYYQALMAPDGVCPLLDAVIKETNRKYPALARLERRLLSERYYLGPEKLELKRGQLIEIPTYAVHYNPHYYPEPEVFRPERFLPQNKHNLVPHAFLAFGDGPRNVSKVVIFFCFLFCF